MRANRKAGQIHQEENLRSGAVPRYLVGKLPESSMERGSQALRARLVAACFPDSVNILKEIVEIAIGKIFDRNVELRRNRRRLSLLIVERENDRGGERAQALEIDRDQVRNVGETRRSKRIVIKSCIGDE